MNKIFVAPRKNELAEVAEPDETLAGFWQGLWHGFTTPFTFLISLFNKEVAVYETQNNGGWYNFGYIFGLMMVFGGSKASRISGVKIEEEIVEVE